ncbi:hypothetical protein [Streptomyces sp. NPDC051016]|uniref:hypothetical protein n=1 Tax=Streptomyces sp. NPDC051016 TaxID=3365638 RepID=UPI0037A48259
MHRCRAYALARRGTHVRQGIRPGVPGRVDFPVGELVAGRRTGGRGGTPAAGEAAALIEEAGGRTAALAEARRHTERAEALLAGLPLASPDLVGLPDFLVRRDL